MRRLITFLLFLIATSPLYAQHAMFFGQTQTPVSSATIVNLCNGASSTCHPSAGVSVSTGIFTADLLEGTATVNYSDSGSNSYASTLQESSGTYGIGVDTNFTVATTLLTTSNSITASTGALAAVSFSPTISSPADVSGGTPPSGGSGPVTINTTGNTTAADICFAVIGAATTTANPFSVDSSTPGWATVVPPSWNNGDNRRGMIAWKVFASGVPVSIVFDTSGAGGTGVIRCYKK